MANEIINRPDWAPAVAADSTIAGGMVGGDWIAPSTAISVPDNLSPALAADWQRTGGVAHHLGTAQQSALTVLQSVEESEEIVAEFDALPEGARTAIIAELARGTWGSIRSASQTEIDRFADDEDGAVLVRSWGGSAPRRVAVVRARLRRVFGQMSAADGEAAATWFAELPAVTAQAVLRELAR